MAYLLSYLYNLIRQTCDEYEDARVTHLPLVSTLKPMVGVIVIYLLFVLHWGPKWMQHRKPYDLKYVMRIYNAIQVIANFSILVYGLKYALFVPGFSVRCQGVDVNNREPWAMHLIYASYGYYLTKYLDLLDTVFFILRKKNNQITFLHVYHHAGMVFAVAMYMSFLAASHSIILGLANALVHTVMYAYYFVTSLRPSAATLWWKRHITQLQLIQFGFLFVHYGKLFIDNSCQHPLLIHFVGCTQNIFMFMLFFDFYYKTYIRKKPPSPSSLLSSASSTQLQSDTATAKAVVAEAPLRLS